MVSALETHIYDNKHISALTMEGGGSAAKADL